MVAARLVNGLALIALMAGYADAGVLLRNLNMLSTEEEIELGKQMSVEVEKQEKVLDDPEVQAYVDRIGKRLARVAPRRDVAYGFKVIDNPDVVNAFSLPGGFMYIYTGLMKICANEAELASVMGHEMGHVAGHHHGESMTRQYGYDMLMSVLLGKKPGGAGQMVKELLNVVRANRFSRENEREADAVGMEILFCAGYDPEAMLTFMNKLLDIERREGRRNLLPIFASHPATQERMQRLAYLVNKYPSDMRANSPRYEDRYEKEILSRLE